MLFRGFELKCQSSVMDLSFTCFTHGLQPHCGTVLNDLAEQIDPSTYILNSELIVSVAFAEPLSYRDRDEPTLDVLGLISFFFSKTHLREEGLCFIPRSALTMQIRLSPSFF